LLVPSLYLMVEDLRGWLGFRTEPAAAGVEDRVGGG
jgi:hypothetical protein